MARTGDVAGAKNECLRLLADAPDDVAALNLLAELYASSNQQDAAVACLERITRLDPRDAAAHRRLGNARFEAQDTAAAISSFRAALELEPRSLAAHNNLGRALLRSGDRRGARASFEQALRLSPDYAFGHVNLAGLLIASGETEPALAHLERAVALRPDIAEAWLKYAALLLDLDRPGDALSSCDRALALNPQFPEALYVRAGCLHELGRFPEALGCCDRALALRPQYAEAHYSRAKILRDAGDGRGSVAGFEAAVRADPGFAAARWARAIAAIPALPQDTGEIERSREEFAGQLTALQDWFATHPCADPTTVVGALQPFFLAYQQRDNRDLLCAYGTLCSDLMREWQKTQGLPAPNGAVRRSRRRLGIVSAQIREHSVFNAITRGWLELLERRHLDITVFYLGTAMDSHTEFARAHADDFQSGPKSLVDWARAIGAREIDVLIYPELGMDRMTLQLASMRLAPVQMVAWGHPETSGLPTIDYYLSAAAFEGDDAARYYREQLVRMPNLGSYYPLPETDAPAPAVDGIKVDDALPTFVCAGTPFKYSAEHDHVFVEIAARLGRCRFQLFEHRDGALSRRLLERIAARFAAAGMDGARYLELRPWATPAEFHALMRAATAQLDTIGFSGFNTVMQAVSCGLPIVTQRGQFLRGRFGSGILQRLEAPQLIAEDAAEYVDTAVRLAQESRFRDAMSDRLLEGREGLYRDREAIAGLQQFLLGL